MAFVAYIGESENEFQFKSTQLPKKLTLPIMSTFPTSMEEPLSILKLFFNWGYYTFLVPFKVVWDSRKNAYILRTNKIQRVSCAIFHALIVYAMVKLSHNAFLDLDLYSAKNGSWLNKLAHLICVVCTYVFHLLCLKSFWMNPSQIVATVNSLSIHNPGRVLKYLWGRPIITRLIGLAFITLINWFHFIWSSENSAAVETSQYQIRTLLEHIQSYVEMPEGGILGSIALAMLQTNVMSFYCFNVWNLFILSCNLSGLGSEFKQNLWKDGGTIDKGLEIFRDLQDKIKVVNALWRGKLWFFTTCILSYYTQFSDFLFGHVADGSLSNLTFYSIINTFVFVVAAYFHALVQGASLEWLEIRHVETVPGNGERGNSKRPEEEPSILSFVGATYDQIRLMQVRHALETSPIALSCGNSPVTYAFLKSLLGVSVAYGIMLSQTRGA